MQTRINGRLAAWTAAVEAAWLEHQPVLRAHEAFTEVNYFTPQPWRNEYDRGTLNEGFTFTVNYRNVGQVCVQGSPFRTWNARPAEAVKPLAVESR